MKHLTVLLIILLAALPAIANSGTFYEPPVKGGPAESQGSGTR